MNFTYTKRAVERIEYFCDFDAPVANAILHILTSVEAGTSSGKPYDQLSDDLPDERRIKEALGDVNPGPGYAIHWEPLIGKSLHTHVLVVVLIEKTNNVVVTAGYIPRQSAEIV